ncbi:Predicted ABC-type molybdate/tungstate transporter, permease component [Desulfosarcina cetonica]|uniref:ABC transporter permease n=1 Tax=Desulfosarcina cetonica TaxID=90730 RepID=UPI0006CFFFE6|nr:ABC transporter permease [Desulfosarcina cetonica]VTR69937.1 Predicted ABC-type molybdate/tungstate transporter, permease component [Desulfosarcina cetonica]
MDFILAGFFEAIRLLLGGDAQTWSAVAATLKASTGSMAVSLVLGIPLGFVLGYVDFPGRRQTRLLVDTALALPTVFIGLVVYAFISNRGPLGGLGLLFTLRGIVVGQTILALPVVIALSAAAVENMDRHLRTLLITLGASRRQLLFSSLWEVRFGLLAAGLAAYGRVMTEVGISMMVGGNIKWHTRTITTAIALETGKGMFATGIALGLVLIAIAFMVNVSLSFLRKR